MPTHLLERRLFPLVLPATVALSLACVGDTGNTTHGGNPGGTAAVGVASRPTTVLPPLATSALDGELGAVLYLGLNYAEWGEGSLDYPEGHPLALARDWTVDGSELTYHMDPSRRWSDGTPIGSRDVVFTYGLLRRLDHMPMSIAAARLDSVVARDDTTVVFHFEGEYPGMLYDTGVGVLPEHVFGNLSEDELVAAARSSSKGKGSLVVSGPFTVAAWGPGDRIELVRNPKSSVRSRLDRLVFRTIPDPVTRLAALRAGELDLVQVESYRQATRLEEATDARVLRVPQRGYDYISWNPVAHPALADRSVRQALSLAIDRDLILAALDMTEFAEKAYGPYGSIFGDLAPSPPPDGDFDRAAARRLLTRAGWVDGEGNGVRDRDGLDLAFELEVPAENERRMDAALLIQAQLAEVGVRLEIKPQEFNSLFTRARARDYEAVFLGWQVGLDPDISFFWADPESPVNVASYDGPEARNHFEAALAAATAPQAAPHWREAARIIAADYPYAFLWHFDFVWLASARLANVRMDPVGFLRNPHEWTVHEER
jgi:peptide/nickel transport system substrate-binding protein